MRNTDRMIAKLDSIHSYGGTTIEVQVLRQILEAGREPENECLDECYHRMNDRLTAIEKQICLILETIGTLSEPEKECEHEWRAISDSQPLYCYKCGIDKPSSEPTITISRRVVQDWVDDPNEDTWADIDSELRKALGKEAQ